MRTFQLSLIFFISTTLSEDREGNDIKVQFLLFIQSSNILGTLQMDCVDMP